jgi:hypothetical protein
MQRAEILIINDLMESVARLLPYFQSQLIGAMAALGDRDK